MDKVVTEGSQWNKWVKNMKRMKRVKVVKRRGQKEHLKQGDEQNKFIYYNNKTYIDTEKISNSTNKIIVCIYVWVCVCECVCV